LGKVLTYQLPTEWAGLKEKTEFLAPFTQEHSLAVVERRIPTLAKKLHLIDTKRQKKMKKKELQVSVSPAIPDASAVATPHGNGNGIPGGSTLLSI